MKRFVRNEWTQTVVAALVIASLTLVTVAATETGAGGVYLFGIGFMAIAIAIKRISESVN